MCNAHVILYISDSPPNNATPTRSLTLPLPDLYPLFPAPFPYRCLNEKLVECAVGRAMELWYDPMVQKSCGEALGPGASMCHTLLNHAIGLCKANGKWNYLFPAQKSPTITATGVHLLRIATAAAGELACGGCSVNHSQKVFEVATRMFILHWEQNLYIPPNGSETVPRDRNIYEWCTGTAMYKCPPSGGEHVRSRLLNMRDVPTAGRLIVISLESYAQLMSPRCSGIDVDDSPEFKAKMKQRVKGILTLMPKVSVPASCRLPLPDNGFSTGDSPGSFQSFKC